MRRRVLATSLGSLMLVGLLSACGVDNALDGPGVDERAPLASEGAPELDLATRQADTPAGTVDADQASAATYVGAVGDEVHTSVTLDEGVDAGFPQKALVYPCDGDNADYITGEVDVDATTLTGSRDSIHGETWNPQGSVSLVGTISENDDVSGTADLTIPGPYVVARNTPHPAVGWMDTYDITFDNAGWSGNAYDIVATVTFTHSSEPSITTEMFYNGGSQWVARFRGSALGVWNYTTSSTEANLDGHSGAVEVVDGPSSQLGPVEADGELLVRRRDNDSETLVLQPFAYDEDALFDHVGLLSTDEATRAGEIQSIFDIAEGAGMDGLMTYTYNNVFSFGDLTYQTHSSNDPDPLTFQIMEELLAEAQARGMYLHVWFWGDEQDTETPIGVDGGVNGTADQRMQRYFAARLGPIPGWMASYGYDLGEWTTTQQVRDWEAYIDDHSGWHHLLMARETIYDPGGDFLMGGDKLDIFSNDDRPLLNNQDVYDRAVFRLNEFGGYPVMFERRFQHTRDGLWDAEATRRSMWAFSVAGVGAVYGNNTGTPYPSADRDRFNVHHDFWTARHIAPRVQVTGVSDEIAMRSEDATRYVVYQEDTGTVSLPLADMAQSQPAVAVDTVSQTYTEIDMGVFSPGNQIWTAPHTSDWAVAVGSDWLRSTLIPDGDGTLRGFEIESAGTSGLYASVDEGVGTPDDDTTYIRNTGVAGASSFFDLSGVPSDFGAMSTLKVRLRMRRE